MGEPGPLASHGQRNVEARLAVIRALGKHFHRHIENNETVDDVTVKVTPGTKLPFTAPGAASAGSADNVPGTQISY